VQRIAFRPAEDSVAATPSPLWDGPTVVLDQGTPSRLPNAPGLEVRELSDALRTTPELLRAAFETAECSDGFEAVNDALFETGLVVVARAGMKARLHVDHAAPRASAPRLVLPRIVVIAESGSELLLAETRRGAPAPTLECAITDVVLGANAKVEHVRISEGASAGGSLRSVRVRQAKDSRYLSRVFTFGGALVRESLSVALAGKGSSTVLEGLYTAGAGELVDHHTRIVHSEPHGSSQERYKGVLSKGGTAVFDGVILVAKDAGKTEAHQENRNLLLSEDAVIHAKPHLEIDTDDVKCSHGTTVGRLDPAQLFYLRSRGLSEEVARAALVAGFAREVLETIDSPEIRTLLEASLGRALPGGETIKELS
jgi:Fe-S cluster assembly protein SufD